MEQFIGILIRRERLRQNYSQEGLCRGICAVSYLSKIEQGKVQAGSKRTFWSRQNLFPR